MRKMINELKKRKFIVIGLLILAIGGFFYFQNQQKAKAAKEIKSTKVQRGDLSEILTLSGEVKARESTDLRFQTSGRLATLKVKNGDVVQKGQLVASLDQRDLRKRLTKELNDFKTTRWEFDQTVDDAKDKAVTTAMQRAIDKTQFSLNNAVLDVELQTISIEFSNLFAPVQGIVTSTGSSLPGVNVTAADTIMKIINPDSLYFEVTADQTEVTKIHEQMAGDLTLDAYIDEPVTGTISAIGFSPKEGESGTVYGVELAFSNSSNQNLKYRVGMTGDVEFVLRERKSVLYVPTEYVEEDEQGTYVFIMKDGKKEKLYVDTGLETDTSMEIVRGLNVGDIVYD